MIPRFKPNNVLAQKIFEAVLQSCRGPERNILEYRMGLGLDKGLTLEKTGELVGLTKERVRQVEDQVLMRIALFASPRVSFGIGGVEMKYLKPGALKEEYERVYGTRQDDEESE